MSTTEPELVASTSNNQPLASPKALPEIQISLIDRTITSQSQGGDGTAEDHPHLDKSPTGEHSLSRRWTKSSLQQQLAQRKYARYSENRVLGGDDPHLNETIQDSSRIERGKKKIRGLNSKRWTRQYQDQDSEIDILYENQRGSFFFGIPLFSSNSLLNFDPKPWINANKKASPVDITNAQVPDPNWEWAWKSWYVDMSRDVDEEGWEYSFSFQSGFAWHGSHPWFHSFVRRRRWLRKRVRKHAHHGEGKTATQKHLNDAHMLTPEYFTIHPSKTRSPGSSRTPSVAASSGLKPNIPDDEDEEAKSQVRDIGTLLVYLRKASIDREKLSLVRSFVNNATDDLFYLGEEMHTIMSLFIFQNSRRHLLRMLMTDFDQASDHRAEHKEHEEAESAPEKQRIDYLLKAVKCADEEVKKLEYWSDIRQIAQKGGTLGALGADDEEDEGDGETPTWPRHQWQGIDASGPLENMGTTAKEKGKSVQEQEREMEHRAQKAEEKAEDAAKAEKSSEEGKVNGDGKVEGLEEVESPPLQRVEEDPIPPSAEQPGKVDKGKGRAN